MKTIILTLCLSLLLAACGGGGTAPTTDENVDPDTNSNTDENSTASGAIYPAFGPDVTECPVTSADLGADVIHVCDCQSGADAACVAGDDADGGSALSPKRTLTAALSAVNAGGDVAFCRGGAWNTSTSLQINAGNCSSASPCMLQDYGNAELPAPLIVQTGELEGGFTFDPSDDSTRWEGVQIRNLHLKKSVENGQGTGIFIFRDVNAIEVRCMEIEGFGLGMYVNPNGLPTGDIGLYDSSIHDNGVMGWLGGTDRAVIERNRFDNNGGYNASAFNHNVYVSDISEGMIVRGNWLTNSAVDTDGRCLGVSLNVHSGITTDLLIEGNLIEETNPFEGCWGLMVDGVGNGEHHTNAIIRGNVVRDVGNQAIGVSACLDCIIENNIVIQTKIGGSIGIASPNRPTDVPDADVTGTVVRNNTVYFAESGNGRAYYVGERGSHYVVTNNIGYSANPLAGDSCYDFDLPASAYDTVSHNLCFGPDFDSGTTGMDSMASVADPIFADAPDDLRLVPASPAIDSGFGISAASHDILGNTRDADPDRGAYEHE